MIDTSSWNIEKNIYLYHGIEVEGKINNNENMIEIIQKEIDEKRPLLINGIYLIIGISSEKRILHAHDILNKKEIEISFESIQKDCKEYHIMNFKSDETVEIGAKEIINKIISRISNESNNIPEMFKHMKMFAEMFMVGFNPIKERGNIDNVNDIPIVERILDISRGRRLFATTLRYIDQINKTNMFNEISNKFEAASDKWILIMGLFEKIFYSTKFSESTKMKIYKYIKESVEYETDLYKSFRELSAIL